VAGGILQQGEVVGLDVEGHEPLQRARTERQAPVVVTQDGLGHDVPAQPA
jgi:hypothetical protein